VKSLHARSLNVTNSVADFNLKDTADAEFLSREPDIQSDIPSITITRRRHVVARDVDALRVLDIALAEIAKIFQLSLRYFVYAAENADNKDEVDLPECIFRGHCLAAHASAAFQVARYMTQRLRAQIAESEGSSQVPSVVQKATQYFFRRTTPSEGTRVQDEDFTVK
jgi:hypothetical protein